MQGVTLRGRLSFCRKRTCNVGSISLVCVQISRLKLNLRDWSLCTIFFFGLVQNLHWKQTYWWWWWVSCSVLWMNDLQVLPQYLIEEIINRLENARNIAIARCVCKSFNEAAVRVQSIRIVCLNEYHDRVRAERRVPTTNLNLNLSSNPNPNPNTNANERANSSAAASTSTSSNTVNNNRLATSTNNNNNDETRRHTVSPSVPSVLNERKVLMFREVVVKVLKNMPCLGQLRIEIEPRLQSKQVPEGERRKTDHWLSDQLYLKKWIPFVKDTLQYLCIIDYAQQAIMRRTPILKLLSLHCEWKFTLLSL